MLQCCSSTCYYNDDTSHYCYTIQIYYKDTSNYSYSIQAHFDSLSSPVYYNTTLLKPNHYDDFIWRQLPSLPLIWQSQNLCCNITWCQTNECEVQQASESLSIWSSNFTMAYGQHIRILFVQHPIVMGYNYCIQGSFKLRLNLSQKHCNCPEQKLRIFNDFGYGWAVVVSWLMITWMLASLEVVFKGPVVWTGKRPETGPNQTTVAVALPFSDGWTAHNRSGWTGCNHFKIPLQNTFKTHLKTQYFTLPHLLRRNPLDSPESSGLDRTPEMSHIVTWWFRRSPLESAGIK